MALVAGLCRLIITMATTSSRTTAPAIAKGRTGSEARWGDGAVKSEGSGVGVELELMGGILPRPPYISAETSEVHRLAKVHPMHLHDDAHLLQAAAHAFADAITEGFFAGRAAGSVEGDQFGAERARRWRSWW